MEVLFNPSAQRKLKSLLLIYFFIGNTKAECPKPEAFENTIPSDQALLLNEFPEGLEITIECGNGYLKESGSDVVRCVGDQWTEPELICKRKDCGPLQPQPHMHFDLSEGTLFGAKAKLSCDDGYTMKGLSYTRCYDAGWRFSSVCERVTCNRPAEVANGRNSWTSDDVPKAGEFIIYSCDKGYSMSGNDRLECLNSGEYDSQPPECIGVTTESTFTTKSVTTAPASTDPAHRDTAITASASPTTSTSERGVTTEDNFTTKLVTSVPASTETETSRSSGLFSTSATHRDAAIPASASPTTSASQREIPPETVNPNKDNVVLFVTTSVLVCSLVFLVVGLILWRFLLRRKGSYDTREHVKPEFVQFQNI